MLASVWRDWINPLQGNPYAFWSGIGSGSPVLVGILLLIRHHQCSVKGCYRLHFAMHPDHGVPVCRKHHPHLNP